MSLSDAAKARTEAAFKRKEEQARDGANAWAEYEAKSRAIAKNMERLRSLRLAKEAAARPRPQSSTVQSPSPNPPLPPQPPPRPRGLRDGTEPAQQNQARTLSSKRAPIPQQAPLAPSATADAESAAPCHESALTSRRIRRAKLDHSTLRFSADSLPRLLTTSY